MRTALSLLHFHFQFHLKPEIQLARICRILLGAGSELSRAGWSPVPFGLTLFGSHVVWLGQNPTLFAPSSSTQPPDSLPAEIMQAAIFNWQHGEVRNQNKTATAANIILVALSLIFDSSWLPCGQSTSLWLVRYMAKGVCFFLHTWQGDARRPQPGHHPPSLKQSNLLLTPNEVLHASIVFWFELRSLTGMDVTDLAIWSFKKQ